MSTKDVSVLAVITAPVVMGLVLLCGLFPETVGPRRSVRA